MTRLKAGYNRLRIIFAALCCSVILSVALITEPILPLKGFSVLNEDSLMSAINCSVYYSNDEELNSDTVYVSYSQIPKHVIDAFVSIEDSRFFEHEGVDYYRILGAALKNIKSRSFKQGASTITQQLIKNTHLTEVKTIKRKLEEVRLARQIERKLSKREILEAYLNKIYFGNNAYGIGNAARLYFGKKVENLSVSEAATLAAVINNPSRFNPLTQIKNVTERRNMVLFAMLKAKKISYETYSTEKNTEIKLVENKKDGLYDIIIQEACRLLDSPKSRILSGNYQIYTTLDKELTSKAQTLIEFEQSKDNINSNVIISNKNGEIVYVYSMGQINPLSTKRQPASTIKPFVCYVPALENKTILPITPILDEKTDFDGYCPKNYQDKYLGWTSAKSCLIHSQNVPAVKLLLSNGIEYSKRIAKRFGLTFTDKDNNPAIALGGMEKGFTLNQLNTAYAALGRNGIYKENYLIKRIVHNGRTVYRHGNDEKKIISDETAYFINDMLSSCAKEGTAKILDGCEYELAAKTGTAGDSNGNTDAYCIAYTPQYTVSVWMGSTVNKMPNEVTGGGKCAEIAKKALSMLDINSELRFNKPKNIIEVEIDKKEYYVNHKVVLALGAKKIDTIKAEFSVKNLPLSYKYYPDNYILLMNDNVFFQGP